MGTSKQLTLWIFCLISVVCAQTDSVFYSTAKNVSAVTGQTVVFQCHVKFIGDGQIIWTYADHNMNISVDGNLLVHGRYSVVKPEGGGNQWNLQISGVMGTDAGSYICSYQQQRQISNLTVTDAENKPRPPPEQLPNVDYTDCCVSRNISASCKPACNPAQFPVSGFDAQRDCATDLRTLIECGSDRRNHIPCCRRRSVPDHCLDWCLGQFPATIDANQAECLHVQADVIVACYQEGHHLLPSPPIFVKGNSLSTTSIRVSWQQPEENGDTVTGYRVFFKQSSDDHFQSRDPQNMLLYYDLADLMPATEYQMYVIATNDHGASLPSYTVKVFTQSDVVRGRGDPTSLINCCKQRHMSEVCVPYLCGGRHQPLGQEEMFGCVTELDKVFTCLSDEKNHTSCCTARMVPDKCIPLCSGQIVKASLSLAACTMYLPDINSCVQENKDSLPGPPRDLILESVTMSEVKLYWEDPAQNANLVTQYRVDLWEDGYNKLRDGSSFMRLDKQVSIPNLKPGTRYNVEVTSVGSDGSSVPSPTIYFLTEQVGGVLPYTTTPSPVLPQQPHDIEACCESEGMTEECQVFCTYNLNLQQDQAVLAQRAFQCQTQLGKVFKCAAGGRNHTSCCQSRGLPNQCLEYCSFDSEKADNFRLMLDHIECLTKLSDMQICMSEGILRIPSPPRQLTVASYDEHTISLMWSEPAANRDMLTGYAVIYNKLSQGQSVERVVVKTADRHMILQNLASDTEYKASVVALAQSGESLPGSTVTVRTLPPPSQHYVNITVPTDLTSCCMSKNVSGECISACASQSTVNLHTCGSQLGNLIECAADNKDHKMCCRRYGVPPHCEGFCEGKPKVVDFTSLLCTVYVEQIMSCFREGFEKLPLQPKNFYPSSIMSRDVELTWEAPEGSDRTFKYDLYYKRFEDVRYTVIEDVESPYMLENLAPFTHYNVYLVALNDYGSSLPTPMFTIWTVAENLPQITITQIKDKKYVQEGERVQLECRADGSPLPTIYWLHEGRKTNSSTLTIDQVRQEDSYRYTCVADNGLENGKVSKDYYLKVQYAPVASAVEEKIEVELGKGLTAVLRCTFEGYPETITWRRQGGDEIPPPNANFNRYDKTRLVQEDKGIITSEVHIYNVRGEDFGMYTCQGENSFGPDHATVSLINPNAGTLTPIPTPPRVANLTACCIKKSIQPECMAACSFDVDITRIMKLDNPLICTPALPKIVACGADGKNHTKCCRDRQVPDACLPYCSGVVDEVALDHLECLGHLEVITDCMEEGNTKIPDAPKNVQGGVENGYIIVWWSQPEDHPERVTEYQVHVQAGGKPKENVTTVSYQVRRIQLDAIDSFTIYDIYVVAANHHGVSQASNKIKIQTYEMFPGPPRRLRGTVGGDGTSVQLQWDAPEDHPGAVKQYIIFYGISGEDKYKQRSVIKATRYTLTNLEPNTKYTIYVNSKTDHYESDKSNIIAIQTEAADGAVSDRQKGRVNTVGIGVGIAILLIVVFVAVGVGAYFYYRMRVKIPHNRFEESVSFENPGYAKANSDGQVSGLPADPVYVEPLPQQIGPGSKPSAPAGEPAIMAEDADLPYTALKSADLQPQQNNVYATISVNQAGADTGDVNIGFDSAS